ncbi:MAG: nuclear transport factor 2 family protein [Alphaproteobacteria bacterium]|nr:nuclear transport factor 2 family protein [Alphaproteobacteria bacterium]
MNEAGASGAERLVRAYYAAFNAGDVEGFLALLTDDVAHDVNQGEREAGKPAFRRFLEHMNRCYRERIEDVVVLTDPAGTRAAAEFVVHGTYIATDPGVPPGTPAARGQTYRLPAGAFFTLRDGRIARISNFYNLPDWLRQIAA